VRHWHGALAGVRPQLAVLSLVTSGPLILLLLAGAFAERGRTIEAAASRARNLAVLGAKQQDDVIQEAATLLRVLALVPDVRGVRDGSCHVLLRRVEENHQRIGTLSVAGSDGQVTCNSRDEQPSLSLAGRPYFAQAMAADTDDLILGSPAAGRTAGRPSLVAAVPLFPPGTAAPDGRKSAGTAPEGVLVAAMDLDWFSRLAARLPGAEANLVQIIDVRDGSTLVRLSVPGAGAADATDRQGLPAAALVTLAHGDPALAAAARDAASGGTLEALDPDGTDRITGFAPLPGTGGNLVLSVGLPRNQVLAAANAQLAAELAVAAAAAGAALLLAALIANRSLLRPIQHMAGVARRLGAGDFGVRTGRLDGAADELRSLAASLDDMGGRLEARSLELAAVQADLRLSEEHYRLLSTCSSDMITRLDAGFRLAYASPACLDLTGFSPEELHGRAAADLVHPEDLAWVNETLCVPLQAGWATARATYRSIRKDGMVVWLESIGRPLPGPAGGHVMVTRDVSARMEMEHRLEEANLLLRGQAMQDPLTALANRRNVDEALGIEFRRSQRLQLPLGILMVDIDHFKAFNDTYGHPAGDACIRAVADAICAVLRRPTDLAGRYGGEEFAVLLPNTDEAGVAVTGERIRRSVQEMGLGHAGSEFGVVTISVGGAAIMPPIGDVGPAAFVDAADAALYAAKRAGRNGVRLGAVAAVAAEAAPALLPVPAALLALSQPDPQPGPQLTPLLIGGGAALPGPTDTGDALAS